MQTWIFGVLACAMMPLTGAAQAGPGPGVAVDSATERRVLAGAGRQFPQFGRALRALRQHDPLLKQVLVVENASAPATPAAAAPDGTVRLVRRFLEQPQPGFDDNRLVVVLYHEVGHLHYFAQVPPGQRSPEASEQAAFAYSLLKTRELAEAGGCGPLQTGLHFMALRSQGRNLADPHVRALQTLVQEPLFAECQRYAASHCPPGR